MRPDELLKKLEDEGFEACFVGGCVRDTLLGRPVHDWDITTSALPEQTMGAVSALHSDGTQTRHGYGASERRKL